MPILKEFSSLMSNTLTDQRNQKNLELIKSEVMVAINYEYKVVKSFLNLHKKVRKC
jgi:hypothetical protein